MKLRSHIEHLFTRQVVIQAIEDWERGSLAQRGTRTRIAALIGALILVTPIVLIALGLWRVLGDLGSFVPTIQGAVLIAVGYSTWPRLPKRPTNGVTRSELPATFALIDTVSDTLGAPRIDAVHFDSEVNAFMASYGVIRRTHHLGLGFLLWDGLSSDQRLSLLGHEIGHLANNDPARGRVLGGAMTVLEQWHRLLDSEENVDAPLPTEILMGALAWLVASIWTLLQRLANLDRQRAEYLADGLGARIGGRQASIETLHRVGLSEEIHRAMHNYHPRAFQGHDGAGILAYFASCLYKIEPHRRAALMAKMEDATLSTDDSHPPSLYRIAFLSEIDVPDTPSLILASGQMSSIDAELAPHRERVGQALFGRFFDANS